MISSTGNPVSAKQKLSLLPSRGWFVVCLFLGLLFQFFPPSSKADSLEDAARALARKVASSTAGLSLNLEVQNSSSLSAPVVSRLTAVFQEELQRHGAKISQGKTAASVVLKLSQNLTEYLGIAQIQKGENSEIIIESWGFLEGNPAVEPRSVYSLRRELLISQESPILDAVLEEDEKHLHALGLQEISNFELQNGQWKLTGTDRLPPQFTVGRDLRGVLSLGMYSETLYWTDRYCRLSFADSSWNCDKNPGLMPIRAVSADLSKKKTGAWISAAQMSADASAAVVVTSADGAARLYEEGPDPVAAFSGWGSEIASVKSGCSPGRQLLVTSSSDWTKADTIQAVEIHDRHASTVSSASEFPGPVIALRSPGGRAETSALDNAAVVAIIRNLQTGTYEVYRLTLTCAN